MRALPRAPPAPAHEPGRHPGRTLDDTQQSDPPWTVTTGSIPRVEDEVTKAPWPSVGDDDTSMLLIDFR